MQARPLTALAVLFALLIGISSIAGCGGTEDPKPNPGKDKPNDSSQKDAEPTKDDDHDHDEVALGKFDINGITVEAAQGHGAVEAGKEGHLVIKLPYNDKGATVVRVWIGTEDRTHSRVGKGEYDDSHDDYVVHANAPDPLPAGAKWWVEIQKPDGSKSLGSIPFLRDIPKTN